MFRIPVVRISHKPVPQHRTAVAGITAGCGTSFIAGSIAWFKSLKGGCTLAELGTPYFCSALNTERRFEGRGFEYFEDALAARRTLCAVKNPYHSLDLFLRRPDAEGFPSPMCACKMPGEQVVFDLSGAPDSLLDEVLPEMDRIILVLDPLPTKLLGGAEKLERLRMQYPDAQLVVNKLNRGVNRSELQRFLGTDSYIAVQHLAPELVYKAEYNCMLPAEFKGFTEKTQWSELEKI